MKILPSGGQQITVSTSYICARCRYKGLLRSFGTPQHRTDVRTLCTERHRRSSSRETRDSARFFTSHSKHRSSEVANLRGAEEDVTVLPKLSFVANKPVVRPYGKRKGREGEIRTELRAWSKLNTEKKIQQAPDAIPTSGSMTILPQSLFLDKDQYTDRGKEEDLDWDGSADDAELGEIVGGFATVKLEPGDLFIYDGELQPRQFAVYLGFLGFQSLVLLANGRWLCEEFREPNGWIVREFASSVEVADVLKHLPRNPLERVSGSGSVESVPHFAELPRQVAEPVLQRLETFDNHVLEFRRGNDHVLDSMWERLADEKFFNLVPFEKVASELTGRNVAEIGDAGCTAISMSAAKSPNIVTLKDAGNYGHHEIFLFSPKRLVRTVDQVKDWIRQYQESAAQATLGKDIGAALRDNPISSFIDKARQRILESRKLRAPTTIGCLGPNLAHQTENGKVEVKDNMVTYSESDKKILAFLHDSCLRTPSVRNRSQIALASLVMRAIGAYPKMLLDQQVGELLLQEMGLVPPWGERSHHNVVIPIPGRPGARLLSAMAAEVDKEVDKLGMKTESEQNPMKDGLADIRKDLDSMEVFAVDPPRAKFPEDGFSLEACADRPGLFWIHVHVINVAAYFLPDHIFGKRARLATSSWYTTNKTEHMIAPDVSRAFSLHPGSATLTFSCLLDEEGQLHDVQVKPTIVRNVINLTHRGLAEALGHEPPEKSYFVVGHDPNQSPEYNTQRGFESYQSEVKKARDYLPTFEKIERLLAARAERRLQEMPQHSKSWFYDGERTHGVNSQESYDDNLAFKSQCFLGDPTIRLEADRYQHLMRANTTEARHDLVTQVMTFCGEAVGKWLRERNVPAIYDYLKLHDLFPLSKLDESNITDRVIMPQHRLSVEPKPHISLAVSQYCKVTSPLRRFTDLIIQWNMTRYLRAVADGVIQPGESADSISSPFPRSEIEKFIANESWLLDWGSRNVQRSYSHWSIQAFFRAVHFKEVQLPEVWDMRVVDTKSYSKARFNPHPDETNMHGVLLPFRVSCIILKSKEGWENSAKKGMYLPIKIEVVDAATQVMLVRPVGPPSHEYTQTGKIELQSDLMTRNVKLKLEADRRKNAATEAPEQETIKTAAAAA